MPYKERYRFLNVSANLHRCRVIREHCDTHGLFPFADFFENRFHNATVEIVDSSQFQIQITVVSGFVAGFKMEKNEVLMTESVYSCLCLALIVGVRESCGTRHFHHIKSGIVSDATDEIHSGNTGTGVDLREKFLQRLHRRPVSTAPRPNAVSLFCSALIKRMFHKQLLRAEDKVIDQVSSLLCCHTVTVVAISPSLFRFYEQRSPFFVGMIMRRSAYNMFISALDDEQMTILYTSNKSHMVVA